MILAGLSLFFLASFQGMAQDWDFEKPDYQLIEKNIAKKKSDLYYPKLMRRYFSGDSTFTLEEKRHLYYGYRYHSNYSPYGESDYSDSLRDILQKEDHTEAELEKIISFADSVFLDNPFNLRAINYQAYALEELGRKEEVMQLINRMNTVVDALISSGNGLSKDEAFYVIYTAHEYDLLNIFGFGFGGKQSLIEHYDYLELAENEAGIEGLYFDVTPCLNHLSDMFDE